MAKVNQASALVLSIVTMAANAQAVRCEKNMSLELANQIASTTVAACTTNGYGVTGTVVDRAVGVGGAPGGHLDEQCALAGIDKVKELLK